MTSRPPHDLVVVGSINVDLTATIERLPRAGETVAGGRLRRDVGGKGANQAVAASRLGARVRMVGAVGDDADGAWALETIRAAGVDVGGVRSLGSATGTALIAVDAAGENQIVVCGGANADVVADGVEISGSEAVLMQLELPIEVVAAVAASAPGLVVVNAAPAAAIAPELIERVDLFIVNEAEQAAMPELRAAERVAVTYGAQGAAMFVRGEETARVPAPRADVVSSVGAGDAFSAALTLALMASTPDEQALRTACAVGAAAVGHPSAQPPLGRLETYA
ncbi:ribokinase [Nocardioides albertanoniae]|uniref:ribokinase n=1 Tax=Nocardioides albertanoniae TaxID=1175486 RepID=UPI0011536818|nr:ribokinase [Nocardioides albertanoniae]